jgi:hypothetical protein
VARVHGQLSWSTDKPSPTEEAGDGIISAEAGDGIIISAEAGDDNVREDGRTPAATISMVST